MECLFRSLRPSTVASVIKIGTVSRAIWPILPGVLYYQYMRQVDEEMYKHDQVVASDAEKSYKAGMPGWRGHYKVQEDVALLRTAALKN